MFDLELIILAATQGLFEFLPISSSAHLRLLEYFFGWQEPDLLIDTTLHIASLLAVILFLRHRISAILSDFFHAPFDLASPNTKLAYQIVVMTIPVAIAGFLAAKILGNLQEQLLFISFGFVFFAFVLWIAARNYQNKYTLNELSWWVILAIGCAQAIAVFPGVSRSGIVFTALLFANVKQREVVEIGFLTSIPSILGAFLIGLKDTEFSQLPTMGYQLVVPFCLAFAIAYAVLWFFLGFIQKLGWLPFVVYRITLGLILVVYVLST